MAFLDLFIRPDGSEPPLKQPFVLLDRISCLLLVHSCFLYTNYTRHYRLYKWTGFAVCNVIGMVLSVVEGLTTNSFGHNIRNLRKAGYSDATILLFAESNRIGSQGIAYCLVNCVVTNDAVYSWRYFADHVDLLPALTRIAINMALSEALFTMGHSLLHKSPSLMKLHVFHHCSTRPTFNTNLLFHPLDLAIEFTAPALSLFLMHWHVWRDDFVLLYSYILFQFWYAYDHDEHIRAYHVQHHADCDSLYAIYCNWRGVPAKNLLRNHMRREGLLTERGPQKVV